MREFNHYKNISGVMREFGVDAPILNGIKIKLDDARINQRIEIAGTVIWCYNSSSDNAKANIKLNSETAYSFEIKKGMMISGIAFSRIFVSNDASASNYLEILYARETDRLLRIKNSVSIANEMRLLSPASLNVPSDVTVSDSTLTSLISSNTDRDNVLITSLKENSSGIIRVGSSSITISKGYPLYPGDTIQFRWKGEIYAYHELGSDQVINVIEEEI